MKLSYKQNHILQDFKKIFLMLLFAAFMVTYICISIIFIFELFVASNIIFGTLATIWVLATVSYVGAWFNNM